MAGVGYDNFGPIRAHEVSSLIQKEKKRDPGKILVIGGCGYIGSMVYEHLRHAGYKIDTMDLEWFGNHVNPNNINIDYAHITRDDLAQYETLFLCAGHSSVTMCERDPHGAFQNNVSNFVNLVSKLTPAHRLIYASSSCVYDGGPMPGVESRRELYPSDHLTLTKATIDRYIQLMPHLDIYGLRFGSVNGMSPSLRVDLMINSMTISAISQGVVNITNPMGWRPILGMRDLCEAVEAVVTYYNTKPGIYNVASFNGRIFDIGLAVGSYFGARFDVKDEGTGYDFTMKTDRFQETFGWKPRQAVSDICDGIAGMLSAVHLRPGTTGRAYRLG